MAFDNCQFFSVLVSFSKRGLYFSDRTYNVSFLIGVEVTYNYLMTKNSNTQKTLNGEFHNWYKIALGFSDQLVSTLLDRFSITPGKWVLDPFCGSGTTLVECKKRSINSVGIDANPSSHFASKVKTHWNLKSTRVLELLDKVENQFFLELGNKDSYKEDTTYSYLTDAGMIDRGWISAEPLRKSILLKKAILGLSTSKAYKDLLYLALLNAVVKDASNVRFGPELYCAPPKTDVDLMEVYKQRIKTIAADLDSIDNDSSVETRVIQGDSRQCDILVGKSTQFASVICSPPYPGEHDYTRHARLELAFLEEVTDRDSLRGIKRKMIRSNTKGIYKEDIDSELVNDNILLKPIVEEIQKRIQGKTHGFARLYPKVVLEYFGGMRRHLKSLQSVLEPGAQCAYVVGDQSSYLQVYIPTAEILAALVKELGYEFIEILPWRTSWASKTSRKVNENILIFRKCK